MPLDFDGTADLINCGSNALSDISSKTISLWCDADTYGELGFGTFFNKTQWIFRLSSGCLEFRQLHTGTNGIWRSAVSSFNTGDFVHVGVTYVNSSTANTPTFYINGSSQTTTTISQPGGSPNGDSSFALFLGNGEFAGETFDGFIEEVTFHNAVLTPAEINTLAMSRLKRTALQIRPASLLLYYPLDEFPNGVAAAGAGSIRNRATNANHGTPTSGPVGRPTQVLSYP